MDIDIEQSPQLAMAWPCETGVAVTATAANIPRDDNDSDVLLDNFFRHSQEIGTEELDHLLDTKFENSDDLLSRRPSFDFDTKSQPDHTAVATSIEPTKPEDGIPLSLQTSSHPPATSQVATMSGLPVNAAGSYQAPANMRFYAPDAFDYEASAHRPQLFQPAPPPQAQPHFANNGPWYPNFNTNNMTSSADYGGPGFSVGFGAQGGYWQYPSPVHSASRPGTADLMDYDNVIPEEDELGDDLDGAEAADPCYAQLLYRCLKEAPDHTLSLKELYHWVSEHSQKAKDTTSKGWQNSVRHNLSMNAAFERVNASTHHGAAKKGSLWRLTPQALQEGVISTTRYRKETKRKSERRSSPALKRQISGAKGGQATRAAANHRRLVQARLNSMHRSARNQRTGPQMSPFPGSSTSAGSCRPSASPSPAFFPVQPPRIGLPHHPTSAPSPHPPSPYFIPSVDKEPFALVGGPPSLNADPHTPPQVQVGFDSGNGRKDTGFLTNFELQHLDHGDRSLFGNADDGMDMIDGAEVETPSLTTEASFFSEERGSVGPVYG